MCVIHMMYMNDSHAWLQVHMTRGRIKACGQVAVADCGAEVHMSDVKARSMCIGGVQAAGFGTTLNLLRCDISDAASATSDAVRNWVVRAVWLQVSLGPETCSTSVFSAILVELQEGGSTGRLVYSRHKHQCYVLLLQGGASGEFIGCQFSNVGCGVTVMDLDTYVEVRDCFAADNDRLGAEVARGATAKFFKSEMSRSRMFKGAYVGGVGTRVVFQDCMFAENQQCALRIDAGAHTTVCVQACHNTMHGMIAYGNTRSM